MKRWLLSLPLVLGLTTVALADPPPQDDPQQEDMASETVSGKRLPSLDLRATPNPSISNEQMEAFQDREFDAVVYRGARVLDLEPAFVNGIREGLELLYLRDYRGARKYFEALEGDYPHTGISATANTLVWQAMMLENFDFKYDEQYWVSSAQARADLEEAIALPGGEGFKQFLMGAIVGIEAIHHMRHEHYLKAIELAFEAMDHVAAAKEAAPEFTDLMLLDGLYNYWVTVVTLSSDILPDFGDERVTGIEQMRHVETHGIFLAAPASLAMAFTWLEEHELKRALEATMRTHRRYPDNVINNLLLGNTYTYMRRYPRALEVYDDILQVAPDNKRVHYYRGVTLLRSGDATAAEQALSTYLAFDYMEDYQRANGLYRMGQALYRQKRYGEAWTTWKEAVHVNGHKGAKAKLERMKRKRREGVIDW